MGRRFADESVKIDAKCCLIKSRKAGTIWPMSKLTGKPTHLRNFSDDLQKIKVDAEAHLGEKVEKAVITVPAYFDDAQRQATNKPAKSPAGSRPDHQRTNRSRFSVRIG